jgi:hypothetical protein
MGLFDEMADWQQRVSWARFWASLPGRRPRHPDRWQGFLLPAEAAEVLGIETDDVFGMVRRGELESQRFDDDLRVRPAIVTKMGIQVRDRVFT